jgi:hypothetical protein
VNRRTGVPCRGSRTHMCRYGAPGGSYLPTFCARVRCAEVERRSTDMCGPWPDPSGDQSATAKSCQWPGTPLRSCVPRFTSGTSDPTSASRIVWLTRISSGCATAAMGAPMCTATPVKSSPWCSTSPRCRPQRTRSPSAAAPDRIARAVSTATDGRGPFEDLVCFDFGISCAGNLVGLPTKSRSSSLASWD